MADRNTIKRRQAIHRRFERALARRELVDGVTQDPVTLELARLRGIEDEAFRLLEEMPDLLSLPSDLAHSLTRLEHAILVEDAAVPTLKPPVDVIALLEDDETFAQICEELQAKRPQ
jgi:hypothetical protein